MRLDVLIEGRRAATLDLRGRAHSALRYTPDYTTMPDATPLSGMWPVAPGEISGPQLGNWLAGLLPDDPRVLNALIAEHRINPTAPLELLGTPMGADCAGAVQFCPPTRTADLAARRGGLDPISDDELLDWLRQIRLRPEYRPRGLRSDIGASLPGMQPKIALRREGGRWTLPWGAEPSSHILKVARTGYEHESLMQHLTMRAAANLGLKVPATSVIRDGDLEVLVVERYDRQRDGARLDRVHQEDLCQALGHPPERKFEAFGGPSPAAISRHIRAVGLSRTPEMLEAFRDMLILQWLTAHNDLHAKNLSMLLMGRACHMAPLYDACTWLPYQQGGIDEVWLAMRLGQEHTVAASDTPDALLRTASEITLPRLATARRFSELAAALPSALERAVERLPHQDQDRPIVRAYVDEQTDRSRKCEQIAEEAVKAVRHSQH